MRKSNNILTLILYEMNIDSSFIYLKERITTVKRV